MSEILCLSGGPDSLIAWFFISHGNKPRCVYVNLNHRYVFKELEAIEKIAEKLKLKIVHAGEIELEKLKKSEWDIVIDDRLMLGDVELPSAEIPLRNSLLAHIASYYGDIVWLAFEKGATINPSHDRSPEFCAKISDLLTHLHGRKTIVDNPFWKTSKGEMVKWYMEHIGDIELLKMTNSCFSSEPGHCGVCRACLRRAVSFTWAGIDCLGDFNSDIRKNPHIQSYIKKMNAGEYDKQRAEETLTVFRKWGVKC